MLDKALFKLAAGSFGRVGLTSEGSRRPEALKPATCSKACTRGAVHLRVLSSNSVPSAFRRTPTSFQEPSRGPQKAPRSRPEAPKTPRCSQEPPSEPQDGSGPPGGSKEPPRGPQEIPGCPLRGSLQGKVRQTAGTPDHPVDKACANLRPRTAKALC